MEISEDIKAVVDSHVDSCLNDAMCCEEKCRAIMVKGREVIRQVRAAVRNKKQNVMNPEPTPPNPQ